MYRLISSGFCLLLCFALGPSVNAQGRRKGSPKASGASSSSWLRSFGGPSVDGGYSVCPATDGGCVACGYTFPSSKSDPLTWVVRLSAAGTKLWDKTFEGAVHGSEAYAICQAPDGGFAVLAPKASNEGGHYKEVVRVIRLDKDGQVVWDKTLADTTALGQFYRAHAILVAPDGGFLLGGFANRQVRTSGQSAWVRKLDSQGNTDWERSLQGACAAERSTALAPAPEGGCVIAYTACASGGGLGLAKLDAAGQVLWEKAYATTFGSGYSDVVKSLVQVPEGGFLLSGGTGSVTRTGFLMKLNAQGEKQWDRYIENANGPAYALPAPDSGVLTVTRWDEYQAKRVDLLILKLDREGNTVWTKVLGDPGGRYDVFGACRSSSGGFFVTGYRGSSHTNTDLSVLRLDEEGNAGKPLRAMSPEQQPAVKENVFQPR